MCLYDGEQLVSTQEVLQPLFTVEQISSTFIHTAVYAGCRTAHFIGISATKVSFLGFDVFSPTVTTVIVSEPAAVLWSGLKLLSLL